MSKLPTLPNELAFLIFDHLDKATLLALAKCCSHLNIIVISYYLSCHHILNPSVLINLDENTFHALPFLRISTLITSSHHLTSRFTDRHYLREIRGLERLVDKLSYVRIASLSLPSISAFAHQDDELYFVETLYGLLTSIIARSCESLSIGGGPNFRYSPCGIGQKLQPIRPSTLYRGFTAPLQRILRKSRARKDSLSLDIPESKLRWLQIASGTFFKGSLVHWMVNLINASLITHLTLINFHHLRTYDWDNLLSAIQCDTLSEFCIRDESCRLEFPCIAAFLARHKTITSFECGGFSRKDLEYPTFSLPRLTRLGSSYETIVYLLEDFTVFPSLHNITLDASRSKPPYPFDPYIMKNALKCVKRCPKEVRLSLRFDQENEFLIEWLDVDVNDNSRVERLLHPVTSLELPVGEFSARTFLLLPKWLALFPALSLFRFQSYACTEMDRQNFARSVIHACSRLRTLTINEETHAVATWLAMKTSYNIPPPPEYAQVESP